MTSRSIYRPSLPDEALRQGEVITDLAQVVSVPNTGGPNIQVSFSVHPYVVVLTQDCDLDLDHQARAGTVAADKKIPAVLLCEVMDTKRLLLQVKASDLKKRIKNNADARYHFLSAVAATEDARGAGIPELAIDFKRYFTMPPEELIHRLNTPISIPSDAEVRAIRRAVLRSPYIEHLSSRFAHYLSRVALPEPHPSE